MHLAQIKINRLFGQFDHYIDFPSPDETTPRPSLVILHGPNGVGKTTILRMLDGLMRLDFNPFRQIPFSSCELLFSTGDCIKVEPQKFGKSDSSLHVSFRQQEALLSRTKPGALTPEYEKAVETFRQDFFSATEGLTFDFIDTERLVRIQSADERDTYSLVNETVLRNYILHTSINPKAREPRLREALSVRVQRFIGEAQLNYRTFFASREPDLFPRILQRLTDTTHTPYEPSDLLNRLAVIRKKDKEIKRFGLEADDWDYESLAKFLEASNSYARSDAALSALGAYVEMLESHLAERVLVAERLLTFEELMKSFFIAKYVRVDSKVGLRIIMDTGAILTEDRLSSGEYHLLYLMVTALTTRRRGTIIAIDEPEMSMHISWQRRLVSALVKCASGAEPQFLFATHSPDIAAEYPESMIRLAPGWSD